MQIPHDEGGKTWFSARHDEAKGPSGSILRLLYVGACQHCLLDREPTEHFAVSRGW